MTFEIVQIIQEFNTVGGAERVAWDLSIAFGQLGQVNSVVASTTPQFPPANVKLRPIVPWLARLPKRGLFRHAGRMVVVPIFTIAANFANLPKRESVLISHGDTFYGDILVVHAVNAENLKEKRRAGQWSWLLNPIHAWVAVRDRLMIGGLRYRRYVAVSGRVKHELMDNYRVPSDRIAIIPNGIDLSKFRAEPRGGHALRAEFGIPDNARLLLFVGHEFSRKGLAYVIQAMQTLNDPTLWLLVVGSDNRKPYVAMAGSLASRIVFAGERRDMERIYPAADAFVLPTAYETFSLVCMEAMACGVPVLATRVGGIEEYLKDGVNGYGIDRDRDDIARKLALVFSGESGLQTLKAGAIATADSYSWNEISRRYVSLAEDVLREKYA
ncbi:glycosyltransferase family 4 protein [Rhizobium sp. VS19-DR104.2]|uniref:glycosyltransferase family 4 protein n=1 Tax=unclassified Rhizobium TaxID=2613769 RepID=UPI001CC49DEC|nr:MULTISPECIES: glycosyltransferase family 4 protein [unclassified Rhizobium]MBZ5762634.1 glycosyltransferase family 4 protein [Rhizobium sp. VS19-DR96]MBZ5768112.1 glycosyltransferase family 4 protein [Rhizobium sp. VS19-DR129.2]MBZ5775518.1 glycosyltransferase family 4 protein [Rhizobium sp. VS19-DRK62.2]MBZ5787364.1 glycosyltransferase family 4 protein [Rhizobium sp. VS19-DR121]MBZ5804038.1 glycosyltransferase family 4 protein [Rhizobium sp. VS19-DR181]